MISAVQGFEPPSNGEDLIGVRLDNAAGGETVRHFTPEEMAHELGTYDINPDHRAAMIDAAREAGYETAPNGKSWDDMSPVKTTGDVSGPGIVTGPDQSL